ncbi:MAG: cardiolipin synthase [Paludibacter sp.]|nr:cardiolipin synthase [Paludibacter sp.]
MTRILAIFFIVLYVYTLISTISVVLLENRNPVKSLSWILVLILLPFFGLFFYLLLGQNFRKEKIISKKSIRRISERPVASHDTELLNTNKIRGNHINLVKLLFKNSEATGYTDNKIEILSDGNSTFRSMFESIKNAKEHIHIEFFIFEDDKISNQMRELLISKANEGVRVRMIYDFIGSWFLSKRYLYSLKKAGVYARPFLPFKLRLGRSKINFRNHRKILVVDGKIGFTGGLNVADRYIYGNALGKWRDTFVRFEGAAVHGLQLLFLNDWYFVERKLISDSKYFPEPQKFNDNLVQIVSSGPDTDWESIMQGMAAAIMSATKYIYIQTPYFVPPDVILNTIQIAALSGVDVRLMVPVKSDSRLSDGCTSSYLGEILEAGVRVFRYEKGFLHSKAIVIDDFISIVGSANMDERSFTSNFEVNAFVYDSETAIQLKNLYFGDSEFCKEITLESWNNRKRSQKLKESITRLFSPLV